MLHEYLEIATKVNISIWVRCLAGFSVQQSYICFDLAKLFYLRASMQMTLCKRSKLIVLVSDYIRKFIEILIDDPEQWF